MQPDAIVRDAPKSMLEANDDDMRGDLFQRLIDAKLMGPTMQLSNTDPGNLPTRELPHGNVAELYMVFVAFCGNKTPASRACFYKEARHAHNCRLLCPMPLNQGCIETICDFFDRVLSTNGFCAIYLTCDNLTGQSSIRIFCSMPR